MTGPGFCREEAARDLRTALDHEQDHRRVAVPHGPVQRRVALRPVPRLRVRPELEPGPATQRTY